MCAQTAVLPLAVQEDTFFSSNGLPFTKQELEKLLEIQWVLGEEGSWPASL